NSATTSRMMPIDSDSRRLRWLGRRRTGAAGSATMDKGPPSTGCVLQQRKLRKRLKDHAPEGRLQLLTAADQTDRIGVVESGLQAQWQSTALNGRTCGRYG